MQTELIKEYISPSCSYRTYSSFQQNNFILCLPRYFSIFNDSGSV